MILCLPLSCLQGVAIAVTGGGSLSLANLALLAATFFTAVFGLSEAGSALSFAAVTVLERPELGALTGTVTVGDPWVYTGNIPQLSGFIVRSGPCTTALVDGHACVGRWPGGYLPNEDCEIAVAGAGGALGPCPVFDTQGGSQDYLTCPPGVWERTAQMGRSWEPARP
eukprot:SAG22_NODE_269_length_13236_cov_124.463424_9_plen_168_part_00